MTSGRSAQEKTVCSLPANAIASLLLQFKIWLLKISPMVWQWILLPSTCTLRELHRAIQVAMRWEGTHLFEFRLRAVPNFSSATERDSPTSTI